MTGNKTIIYVVKIQGGKNTGFRGKRQIDDEYDEGMYSEGNEEENNYDLDDDSLKRKKRSTKNGKGFGRNTGNGKWGASRDKQDTYNYGNYLHKNQDSHTPKL